MRKIGIVFLLMWISTFAFPQWTPLSSGTTSDLSSVYFIDFSTGYAVGKNGTILKTNNSGINWTNQLSGTNKRLNSVFFSDTLTGYSVGDSGTILKTNNGGNTWTPVSSGTNNCLEEIYFTDPNQGYIVGDNGTILKTIDAGASWSQLTSGNNYSNLYSVFFTDINNGFVVGDSFVVLKTDNSGVTWSDSLSPFGPGNYYSVCFVNSDTGFAIGDLAWHGPHGVIDRTTDGGHTWYYTQFPGVDQVLLSVKFPSVNIGYVVGAAGIIFKTTNGGENWARQSSGTSNSLSSVFFTDINTGYIVGGNGMILKTTNGGTFIDDTKHSESTIKLYPNPASNKIFITNKDYSKETLVSIVNIQGKQNSYNKILNENSIEIDLTNLTKGMYFVTIQTDKKIETKKLIVQ